MKHSPIAINLPHLKRASHQIGAKLYTACTSFALMTGVVALMACKVCARFFNNYYIMKRTLNLFIFSIFIMLGLSSCQEVDPWDFDYSKEDLCGGTWRGSEFFLDGKWIDITRPEYRDLQFTISFSTDGTYYGTGYFGNGSGTYEAHGKTIKTYVEGKLFYTYTIHSLSGNVAEITMTDSKGSSLKFRVKKQ